jgi:TolA-binding protein
VSHTCDGRDLSCASCAALARRLDTVRAAMTTDDELDDIKRARIWTQLEDRLAAAPPRRSRRPIAIGAAAALCAAAGAAAALWPREDELHTLAVPVDTVVSSRLGPHTSATIVGPARLEILGAAGDTTAVRLRSGTLLAEFAGGTGRALRIDAPGAVIEVVGTLFAVEVRDRTTCTSVAHGRVRVITRAGTLHVAGGQRYCTGDAIGDPIRAITADTRDALARHGTRVELASGARSNSPPGTPQPPARDPSMSRSAGEAETGSPATGPGRASPIATEKREQSAAETTASSARSPALAASDPPARLSVPAAADPSTRSRRAVAPPSSSSLPVPPAVDAPPRAPSLPRALPPSRVVSSLASSPPADLPRAPAVPPAPDPAPSRPPPGPEELYRTAEAALAARDPAAADRALAELLTAHPGSLLVDQALYERARIAYQQRAWAAARSHLARLAQIPRTLLAEPGRYLRCRIAVETAEPSAEACLADYRAAFPRSPHDLDALALLVQLTHARGGCAGAESLVDELAQSYPRTTLAAAWRTRCPEPR